MIIPGAPNPLMWGQGDPLDEIAKIERSVRIRRAASASFSRVFGTPTNSLKYTAVFRLKRGSLGAQMDLLSVLNGQESRMSFKPDDSLWFYPYGYGASDPEVYSTSPYRECAAFYDVQFNYDANNAVAADRMVISVNGFRVAVGSVTAPLGYTSALNTAATHYLGRYATSSGYFDGLIAQFCFVDGQSLPTTAFGQFHPITRQWRPKSKAAIRAAVAAGGGPRNGWGANGCLLPFDDNSSATALGYDRSQSDTDTTGNNWTVNNISVTPGVTYDSLTDGTDNLCTFNPLEFAGNPIHPLYSYGNLRVTDAGSVSYNTASNGTIRVDPSKGPWKWECVIGADVVVSGVTDANYSNCRYSGVGYNSSNGQVYLNSATVATVATATTGDVIGFEFDDANVLIFKNNSLIRTQPWTPAGLVAPSVFLQNQTGGIVDGNFGQRTFATTGFSSSSKAISAKNLPFPLISDPSQHHTVVTVTKTGDTNFTIPWDATLYDTYFEIKRRDASGDWYQIDGLRGYDKYLSSNSTAAEVTDANVLGVSGFTGTLKSTLPNGSYVISMHKAGLASARTTNTDGTITSVVSVNQISGFSIATYTGTGADATIGHGLGVAPKMVIGKCRNATQNWVVSALPASLGSNSVLYLNGTAAHSTADTTVWNSAYPTTSVFSVGTNGVVNGNTYQYVAYCFAEILGYSKIDSYVGNGSADGPFVYCGFRPRWLLVKRADSMGNWILYDTLRSTANVADQTLYPNLSQGEDNPGGVGFDITAQGFKARATSISMNANGGTHIFYAIAEFPFRYANAR